MQNVFESEIAWPFIFPRSAQSLTIMQHRNDLPGKFSEQRGKPKNRGKGRRPREERSKMSKYEERERTYMKIKGC